MLTTKSKNTSFTPFDSTFDILRTLNISKGAPAAHVNSVANPAAARKTNSLPPVSSSKKIELNDRLNSSVAPKPKIPNTTEADDINQRMHLFYT